MNPTLFPISNLFDTKSDTLSDTKFLCYLIRYIFLKNKIFNTKSKFFKQNLQVPKPKRHTLESIKIKSERERSVEKKVFFSGPF